MVLGGGAWKILRVKGGLNPPPPKQTVGTAVVGSYQHLRGTDHINTSSEKRLYLIVHVDEARVCV
jgi:hypothetical protein